MSAQANFESSTSQQGFYRHTPQGTLRVIEGGRLDLGEMPTPVAVQPLPTGVEMPFDCPAPKFEQRGTGISHDINL